MRYTIDAGTVRSFEDFIEAANVGLIEPLGGRWTGNLDALNDDLRWPGDPRIELEILGAEACAQHLGHAAQAARLRARLQTCHPSNQASLREELSRAEAGQGPTLFDILCEIFESHDHLDLRLR